MLRRAGGDDERLKWDVWPGNSVRQGSGLLKADALENNSDNNDNNNPLRKYYS